MKRKTMISLQKNSNKAMRVEMRASCIYAVILLSLSGCLHTVPTHPCAVVVQVQKAITVDGKLNEESWRAAPAHYLELLDSSATLPDATRASIRSDSYEGGTARFLLDEEFLYIGIEFEDRDIVAQINQDQAHLYSSGDVAEIFIKDANSPGYWELYVSPLGNKTSFFFPSPGYLGLPECTLGGLMDKFKAAAVVKGTVNDFADSDEGWTAEMAVPLSELGFGVNTNSIPVGSWSMLVARYNYGHSLRVRQYSSYPKLPQINFHLIEFYASAVVRSPGRANTR